MLPSNDLRIVLHTSPQALPRWRQELLEQAPRLNLALWPEIGDPAEVDAVLCWLPPAELFAGMTNLRFVQYLGAGVDGLLASGVAMPRVPIARMVDPVMSRRMAEYALFATLRAHRRFDAYQRQQPNRDYTRHIHEDPGKIGVGVMGTGEIGMETAQLLRQVGYDVVGWSRRPKPDAPFEVFAGEAGLRPFLARSQVVICLVPLTPATHGILDAAAFAAMPAGGTVVNIARGQHLVVPDLLAALDSGHLGGAVLDVFDEEPLPASSPLWAHPKVMLTPHTAGITNPRTAVTTVLAQLARLERGLPLHDVVDLDRGY